MTSIDEHELKMMRNAILPDIVKAMVQNFQKRLNKVYPRKSTENSKILDHYTTEFDQILCLNFEYLETTKLLTELDKTYTDKFKLK